MESVLKIGDFSRINNISIQALRYYDQINLIKPYYVDNFTKYRYYHINQSALVDMVQYLRQLDFSIDKIKELLTGTDPSMLMAEIQNQHTLLLQEQAKIDSKIKELSQYQQSAQLYLTYRDFNNIHIEQFPKRSILSYHLTDNIYQMSDEDYEASLRKFKSIFPSHQDTMNAFTRVGTIMTKENFLSDHWYADEMFIFHHHKRYPTSLQSSSIPKGLFAIGYCHSFQEEISYLPHFKQAIMEKGYTIAGNYICEVIYEHPLIHEQKRHMFIRVQVPVKENNLLI